MIYGIEFVQNHGLYRLHRDTLRFFEEARTLTRFNLQTLFSNELRNVVTNSHVLDRKFRNVFRLLNQPGINKNDFYNFLTNNNEIRQLVENIAFPLLQLPANYDRLKTATFSLFEFLWLNTLHTDICENNYGSLNEHYQQFYDLNSNKRLCAFCGLEKIKRPSEQRNEYDHYLGQGAFKWCSVNFANLVAMCGTCNKRPNKGSKIMIFNDDTAQRRLAYYPYSQIPHQAISVDCQNLFAANENWQVGIVSVNPSESFDTWKNVFNIDLRYRNTLKDEYRSWIIDLYAYCENNLPDNTNALRASIDQYRTYRRNSSIKPAYFIELSFWDYLFMAPDLDLTLILNLLQERHDILAPTVGA
jgi:hypothetical protein